MPTDKSPQQKNQINLNYRATESDHGMRIDQLLTTLHPDVSRSRWQASIKCGDVLCNGKRVKPKQPVLACDQICGAVVLAANESHRPQAIPLDVIYQDSDLIIVNKPAGLVVHPAAGNADSTLLNALLHHFPATSELPRAGIVHRLDKILLV